MAKIAKIDISSEIDTFLFMATSKKRFVQVFEKASRKTFLVAWRSDKEQRSEISMENPFDLTDDFFVGFQDETRYIKNTF